MEASTTSHSKLLSIIIASNRPHNMAGFLENLKETLGDFRSVEVLVKIDEGDDAMHHLLEDAIKRYDFEIRYIQTPRLDGYYSLHYGYQQLFEISDPTTYYIFVVNEEVRFKTKGWDSVLRNYIGFFADHVFRLKISRLKYRNYYSYHECAPCPENYPFLTRKWVELAEGIGDCWGPDGWHQFIDYHLARCSHLNDIQGVFRSVPIDILIDGEETGKELTEEQINRRSYRIAQEWWRMYSHRTQQQLRRLATKMFCYIWAKNEKLDHVDLIDNKRKKFYDIEQNGENIKNFNYHLSPSYIHLMNFGFLIDITRWGHFDFMKAFVFSANPPANIFIRCGYYVMRSVVLVFAFLLGLCTTGYETPSLTWRIKNSMIKVLMVTFGNKRGKEIASSIKKKWSRRNAI